MEQRYYAHPFALPESNANRMIRFSCAERSRLIAASSDRSNSSNVPIFQVGSDGYPLAGDGVVCGGFDGIDTCGPLMAPARKVLFRLPIDCVFLFVLTEDAIRPECSLKFVERRFVDSYPAPGVIGSNSPDGNGTQYYKVTLPSGRMLEDMFPLGAALDLENLPPGVRFTETTI